MNDKQLEGDQGEPPAASPAENVSNYSRPEMAEFGRTDELIQGFMGIYPDAYSGYRRCD